MNNVLVVIGLALVLNPLLWWLGRVLPDERWQFLASLPMRRCKDGGRWEGINLTFYGLLIAGAGVLAVTIFLLLLAALAVPPARILLLILLVLGGAVAASKLVAVLVEKKNNTFTVAGGATAGLYLLPLLIWLYNSMLAPAGGELAALPLLAALAAAFIIGEGVGRLACLSFGCCYGKPLSRLGPRGRRFFAPIACVYSGENKKIAYADNLAGVPVVPVQFLTSLAYVNVGLVAISLFLFGYFGAAFALAATFSLAWRVLAEQFRADYRGGGRFSAYQLTNLINIVFCLFLLWWLPAPMDVVVRLEEGAAALWHPGVLLFLQLTGLLLLLYFGISRVTGVRMEFNVRRDRI